MSKFYHCILCQNVNASVMDLHNHHIQQHTLEELSCMIIDLQGFKLNNEKLFQSVIVSDDNNNKNVCNRFVIKTEKPDCHDEVYCSLHCSRFIAWEHELNKRIEITDDDFFSIIDNFCSDLSKRKQRGRKRKYKAIVNNRNIEDQVIRVKENEKCKTENNTLQEDNYSPMQIATTASSSTEDSINNTTINDEIFQTQMNIQPNIGYNDVTTLTELHIKPESNFLVYNPSTGTFSWGSILSANSD